MSYMPTSRYVHTRVSGAEDTHVHVLVGFAGIVVNDHLCSEIGQVFRLHGLFSMVVFKSYIYIYIHRVHTLGHS